jgi:hemolysin D
VTQTTTPETNETLDLAALGKAWTPAQAPDTAPEVSDMLAARPRWAARGLLYIVVSFVFLGAVWACFSPVDIVVEARGSVIPEGYVRPVQAVLPGVVQTVKVREGDFVQRGAPIIQLESEEQQAHLAKLHEELETTQRQLAQFQTGVRTAGVDIADKENRIKQLDRDISATELAVRQALIKAPVRGTITSLDVRSIGAVVQAGQKIAEIAPEGARLLVEARVANKDVAFIRPGLITQVKLDALPFQDYGSLPGKVLEVSQNALVDGNGGSFYKVTIEVDRTTIRAKGREITLLPGMALSADIVTERTTVMDLLLEPLRKVRGDMGGTN